MSLFCFINVIRDACLKFMDLWKKKHESGQWLEIEATQPNISPKNASGTMLANAANMRRNSWPGSPENNNGKTIHCFAQSIFIPIILFSIQM